MPRNYDIDTKVPKKPGEKIRCTKKEKEYRLRKLLHLSKNGWSTDQLEDFACQEWGLKIQQARAYVGDVLDSCVAAVSTLDKRRIAALTLMRFENAYRMAASQRNPSAMVAANAQIALHWVHHAPEITVNATEASNSLDPEEEF